LSQRKKVSLKGFGRETVVFQIASAIPGNYTGAAEVLFEDELKFDNRRYVAFEARRPDRLLIVDGQEGSSVYASETYYLETALRVGRENSDRDLPSFEIERIVWDNGKGFPDLTGFRVIALANVGHFSSEDASRLKDFLATGGRLLVCCGDQFTQRAAEPLANAGILPASLEGVASLGPYRISSWSKEHPIFLPFGDPQYGDVRRLRFNKIARLKPSNADSLAQIPAGDPLIVESQLGEGKVLLWATTIDTAWTSFPRSRLFVPLTRQIFAYLTDQHVREHAIEELIANRRAGISRQDDRILVFNAAPEESELARVTPDEFRQSFRLPDKQEFADLSTEQLAALAPPPNSERPEEVWRTIAWILLGWLVVETFLAGRVHA
jgi:hypothetical protein